MKKFISLLLACISFSAHTQITSTFDTDADGWTFFNASNNSISFTHNVANGNPGGYVSATYSSSSGTGNAVTNLNNQVWFAPAKFRGNHLVRSLGLNLKFDLQQSQAGAVSGFDVIIENANNYIYFNLPVKPAVSPTWSSYTLALDETISWRYNSGGAIASRQQIIGILTNVTSIEIRGTYATNAAYTSGLDNVVLEQRTLTPPPTATSLSATSGKPGDLITVQGNGFRSTISENEVYFGSIAGVITNASTTSLTVIVPIGAQYGNITFINKITGLSKQSVKPFNPTFGGGGKIIPASFKSKIDITLDAAAGNNLGGLSVADIDGDGWNDLLVAESSINSISIFRNLGSGGELSTTSFAAKVSLTGAGNRSGLRIIDLDGDGKLDIATGFLTSFGTFRNTSTPGNLSFEPVELWAGFLSGSLSAIEDIDGDGRFDLIGQHGSGSVFLDFWIAQNISSPGNIEFGSSVSYFGGATLDAGAGVSTGDLDNDGVPEIIVKHNFGGQFQVIKNNSTPGVISLGTPFPIAQSSNGGIIIADFNLDGKNDLAWKQGFSNDDVRIRLNTNNGGALVATDFNTEIILNADLLNFGAISVGDINGDGKPDILASDSRQIGVFENIFDGGAFSEASFIPSHVFEASGNSTYPTGIIPADLNGDQKPDLIVGITNTNPVRILLYENKNVHAPVISLNTVSPLAAPVGATVTITGNNFSTITSENRVWFGGVEANVISATATEIKAEVPAGAGYERVSVVRGKLTSYYHLPFNVTFSPGVIFDGTSFLPPVTLPLTGANYDVEVADLNNDGKPDIVAESNVSFFQGLAYRNVHTTGAITSASLILDDTTSTASQDLKLMDVDADGKLDILSSHGIYKNSSTTSEISFDVVSGLNSLRFSSWADFNLDGMIDIVSITSSSGNLSVYENRYRGYGAFITVAFPTFSAAINLLKPAINGGAVSADFDSDGLVDLVSTNPGTDNIRIWRNTSAYRIVTSQFTSVGDINAGDNPGRIYAGDLDSDGKMDLVLYHGTGTTTTLLTIFHNTSSVGNISFNRIDLTNPSPTTVAHIADLDGDGRPEIITTSEAGNRFSIFKNIHTTGALTAASFAAPFNTTVTAPRGLATGDLNLDGKPEIIITRAAGFLVVYENLITPPTISSFTPASGPIGTTVTITGTNFSAITSNNTVTFNGVAATVTASAATSITVTVPLGATTGSIAVTVAGITATSATNFTVTTVSLPTIISFAPPAGIIGASVTITGTNFSTTPANNTVMFNGTTATVTASTATSITTTVPSGATTGTITVTIASNTATSATNFTVTTAALPTITSFNPTSGSVGTSVIITGTNFNTTPANNTVRFNGTTSVVTASTVSGITTTVPLGATSGKITVTVAGNTATSTNDFTVTVPVGNPPVINTATTSTIIGGIASIPLTPLLSDPDNNLDLSTLKIIVQPTSGALATIDANKNLKIDYTGNLFAGTDELTIEVCDLTANCVQKIISIEVSGEIVIYNGISPNTDGKNDAWIIKNIAALPETRDNKVTIFNRWGSKVFEVENYNNTSNVFKGLNDNGNELPSGTYFYKILFSSGREAKTGYLTMKR